MLRPTNLGHLNRMELSAGAKGIQRRPGGLVSLRYSKHWPLDSAPTILATGQNWFFMPNSCETREQVYLMTQKNTKSPKRKFSGFFANKLHEVIIIM